MCHQSRRSSGLRSTWDVSFVTLAILLGSLCVSQSSSRAAFSQSSMCQIGPGKDGAEEASTTFEPGGIAVDAEDRLLVGEPVPGSLASFEPAYANCGRFVSSVELEPSLSEFERTVNPPPVLTKSLMPPITLSPEWSTNHVYVTGNNTRTAYSPYVESFDTAGHLVTRWEKFEFGTAAHVAVDNSTDPLKDPSACGTSPLIIASECFVYASHGNPDVSAGHELPEGIEKFTASGVPASFVSSATCTTPSGYVSGNEITGTPSGGPFTFGQPGEIAVDPFGNIYAVRQAEVDEFGPCGAFRRSFLGGQTPGLKGGRDNGGFGGNLGGVAIDPVSGLLAVSVRSTVFNEPAKDEGTVDEFDPTTGRFVDQITEASAGEPLKSALELTFDSRGDLYVVDGDQRTVHVYGPGRFVPGFRLADASNRTPISVVLNGWIDPESAADPENPAPSLTQCDFQYVTTGAYEQEGFSKPMVVACSPAASEIAAETWTPVHADVGGLVAGTTYYYRIVASIAGAFGGLGASSPIGFTAPAAPRIDRTFATNLSSTFADLHSELAARGAKTTYHFEYVDEPNYDASGYTNAQMTPETGIGSGGPTGGGDANVLQQVGGLAPGLTYKFRVVAKNEIEGKVEVAVGPDVNFTTLPAVSPRLPDGRAYEIVTPANKGGGTDMFAVPPSDNEYSNHDVGYPSAAGDAFLLETNSALGTFPSMLGNVYVFRRSHESSGWPFIALASPSLGVQNTSAPVFDPTDFLKFGVNDGIGSYASEAGQHYVGLSGTPGGPYSPVFSDAEAFHNLSTLHNEIVGSSHDLNRLFIEAPDEPLASGAEKGDPESRALYEWNGKGECNATTSNCQLVSHDPEGVAFRCGAMLGQGPYPGTKRNAVSYNGETIFFTAPDPRVRSNGGASTAGCWNGATKNSPQLYMRSAGGTVEVSAPQGVTVPAGATHPAVYVGASGDGTKVFFVSETELTPDAVQADSVAHAPELYEYNSEAPEGARLVRISGGDRSSPVEGHVDFVPAISSDGAVAYFTGRGQLVPGLPTLGPEEVYLYRYDTSAAETRYVTTVGTRDFPEDDINSWWQGLGSQLPIEIALNTEANWYTSPDGAYLLFATWRELTPGYSTAGSCVLPRSQDYLNGHCVELYRYHYERHPDGANTLVCVSCDPSGVPPASNAEFTRSVPSGVSGLSAEPVRGMSDDGKYVFFDKADPLVAQDGNGTLDVYEWHDGRTALIGSGADRAPSFFLGATADGSNVFFGTHSQLVPQDTDGNGDVYDARVCTGADSCLKPEAAETAQCEGDACQSQVPTQIDSTPASLSFTGAGNASPATPASSKKTLTRAQQLTKALKACRRQGRRRRAACERRATKRSAVKVRKSRTLRRANKQRVGRVGK